METLAEERESARRLKGGLASARSKRFELTGPIVGIKIATYEIQGREASMPLAPVNGIDLYYELHGSGPTVVFAHGAGGNHASWYQQVPFFSRFYEVVTFDHRGFGNSIDANGLGRGGFVDDLEGLVEHLGREEVALVAQSMGGGTCMSFTVRHPERVTALVMADTFGAMTLPEPFHSVQQQRSEATRGLSQLDRVVSKSLPVRDPA